MERRRGIGCIRPGPVPPRPERSQDVRVQPGPGEVPLCRLGARSTAGFVVL